MRVDVPPTYFHNEKEKKREEEEEPAKKVRRTRKQALALHTRARQSALRATMAQAFLLLLLLLSSAPARLLFFKSTITSIDFQLKWSRKVSISSAGTIGKRSRERPRSKRHRSSIKIIKKSIDCTTKIYRNGPEVTKNENYVQLLCASKGKWRHTRFVKTAKRKYRK